MTTMDKEALRGALSWKGNLTDALSVITEAARAHLEQLDAPDHDAELHSVLKEVDEWGIDDHKPYMGKEEAALRNKISKTLAKYDNRGGV